MLTGGDLENAYRGRLICVLAVYLLGTSQHFYC